MKIFSLQGILLTVVIYVIADRLLDYSGKYGGSGFTQPTLGGTSLDLTFGKNSLIVLAGSLATVYFMPRLF